MTKIKFSLSPDSIERAIQELNSYTQEVERKASEVVRTLTEQGVEIAKQEVSEMDAVYTGELKNSIYGEYDAVTGTGRIKVKAPYAKFVEFGTGIVGKNASHPEPQGWQYDINDHGEKGWIYLNERDGRLHWTQGFRSRPFMYNTARRLREIAGATLRVVFRR